jgi:hypothetical protein
VQGVHIACICYLEIIPPFGSNLSLPTAHTHPHARSRTLRHASAHTHTHAHMHVTHTQVKQEAADMGNQKDIEYPPWLEGTWQVSFDTVIGFF